MKAVQIVKPNDLRIIDMDKPTIDAKNNVLVKIKAAGICGSDVGICLLYTSPSPRDRTRSRMPSSA